MNRLVRGSVLFAVAAIVGACGGTDTEGIDETDHLVSDPAIVFVSNVDSQAVFVEAVNALGQQLEGDFAITSVGTGLSAVIDTSFAPVLGREGNPTRVRIFVKAATTSSLVSSSFTVTANGVSLDIPVAITPSTLLGNLTNPTPNVGDTIGFVGSAPLTFTAASTITFATGGAGIVTGVSQDGTTLFFLAPPGGSGDATITDVHLPYLSAGLTLTEVGGTGALAVQNATSLTGTDASGTAPTFTAPDITGATTSFFDLGSWVASCGGVPCQWYKLTVATAGDYFIHSSWDNTSDIGVFILASDAATQVAGFDAHGNGATAQPEEGSVTLAAGTYFIVVENFAPFYPDPDPAWFRIDITLE